MLSIVLIVTLVGTGQTAGGEPFVAEGVFTIATPDSLAWSLVKEDQVDGMPIRAYVCAGEGSRTRIVLTVEGRVVTTDQDKSAAVKGHWNGMLEMLQKAGFQRPETHRPRLEPPLGARVGYRLAGDDPTGARRYIRCMTIFGKKNIYLIQAITASVEEADALMPTFDSFRELP